MKKLLSTSIFISIFLLQSFAQQVEKSTYGTVALTNATVETVTKGRIKNATVIIRDGLITAVGKDVGIPNDAKIINCQGMFIYPGMIDGGTRLGLQEVESISLTHDYDELGEIGRASCRQRV